MIKHSTLFGGGILAIITILVYWPGLSGIFYFDDYGQIIINSAIQITSFSVSELTKAAHSSLSGPFGRPISMVSFAMDYKFNGLNPWTMKLENVLLHIINGFLLIQLLVILVNETNNEKIETDWQITSNTTALVIAGIWMLHPFNLTPVLYVVQRMTTLSATFTLLGIYSYSYFRSQPRRNSTFLLSITMLLLCTLLATLSKETGLLTVVYAGIIELFILTFRNTNKIEKELLKWAYIWMPICLTIAGIFFIFTHPYWVESSYSGRPFTMLERLLTESRALAFYERMIAFPNIKDMGLYHDDFKISKTLFEPPTTLLSFVLHIFLILIASLVTKTLPLVSFGIFWFYGGHLLESTIFPLELVFEHRNYLPSIGLVVALYSLVGRLLKSQNATLNAAIGSSLLVAFALTTSVRASDWGDVLSHAIMEANRHPNSARANFDAATFLSTTLTSNPNHDAEIYPRAKGYFLSASKVAPDSIAPLIGLLSLDAKTARGVDQQILSKLEGRLRSGRPDAASGNNLRNIVKLLEDHEDVFSVQQATDIFEAMLANPRLAPRDQGVALVGYGLFMIGRTGDDKHGLDYLRRATMVAPGIVENWVILAAKLADYGLVVEASKALDMAKSIDKYRHFEDEIHAIENFMSKSAADPVLGSKS